MPGSRSCPTLLVVGAGDRGSTYARYVLRHPDEGRVVAVADPRPEARERLAGEHRLEPRACYADWHDALAAGCRADAVVIATQDRDHVAPAIAFARAGRHLLVEKPLAPTAAECRAVVDAVRAAGVLFAVGHVLRYAPYTELVRQLVGNGAIGEVVGIQRLEPVGFWHFAHSYVRGNWRKEAASSPILLAKCCHDVDWIRYVIGTRCVKVSSFGGRAHFRADRRPAGAADRCVDCSLEPGCPYSAVRLYLARAGQGQFDWPVSVLDAAETVPAVRRALTTGPYGRCVYACDNDVPDHQIVNLEHAGSRYATLTMSAFTPFLMRRTTIFGSQGWLVGDGTRIEHHDFVTDSCRTHEIVPPGGQHGGGDDGLMRAFLSAISQQDRSLLRADAAETLETHLTVFAAEQSRLLNRVVSLDSPEAS